MVQISLEVALLRNDKHSPLSSRPPLAFQEEKANKGYAELRRTEVVGVAPVSQWAHLTLSTAELGADRVGWRRLSRVLAVTCLSGQLDKLGQELSRGRYMSLSVVFIEVSLHLTFVSLKRIRLLSLTQAARFASVARTRARDDGFWV